MVCWTVPMVCLAPWVEPLDAPTEAPLDPLLPPLLPPLVFPPEEPPPVEPFPDLDLTQVPTPGRANGATSLSRLELKGTGHIAMLDSLQFVRKAG